jgi:glycosyltransferase involved in cell wall biosynthesis
MRYVLADLDLAGPLPPLELPPDASGAGILVRRNDRPVAFFMTSSQPRRIGPDELRELAWKNAGIDIISDVLRSELAYSEEKGKLPPVTVAICTRNHPALVERAIHSILAASRAVELQHPFEILVVDNAPSDGRTLAVARSVGHVRYVREPRPGLDFARNCATAEAHGEILAFVDDDVVVDRGWLCGLRRALSENPDAAAITGPVLPYELETTAQILFEARGGFGRVFRAERFGSDCKLIRNYPCNAGLFGSGCNMAFRRDVLQKIGGFDEALDTGAPLPGGGDLDILHRILRGGYVLVREPQFLIRHEHRKRYRDLRHQMYTWGLGMMAYAAKHYREDVAYRGRFRCMMLGWLRETMKLLIMTASGRREWRVGLACSEILGGIVGFCGEYERSKRRIAKIRKQFAGPVPRLESPAR